MPVAEECSCGLSIYLLHPIGLGAVVWRISYWDVSDGDRVPPVVQSSRAWTPKGGRPTH